ncbi:hypothetical protein B0H14DRAFT_2641371 [Mycena olivaceomarginata]|nr:hypothetical protein B0H14DRAFT_2641371 [Mycena olivaceomarginata]
MTRSISSRRKRNRMVSLKRDVYKPLGITAADVKADCIARAAFKARVVAQFVQGLDDPSVVRTRMPSSWDTGETDGRWGGWGTGSSSGWGMGEWGSGGEWGPSEGSGGEMSSGTA